MPGPRQGQPPTPDGLGLMAPEIRAIEPGEFQDMRRAMGLVFGFDPPDALTMTRRSTPCNASGVKAPVCARTS